MGTEDLTPLLAQLQDERHEVRSQAALTLLRLRDPATVPQLLTALAIPDRSVRAVLATVQSCVQSCPGKRHGMSGSAMHGSQLPLLEEGEVRHS